MYNLISTFAEIYNMRYLPLLAVILFFVSCGEDKHKLDVEENTYYSKYIEIYNAYDSLGAEKTLENLDEYITEFPNAQDAYIFKAWVLAENNQLNKIDEVFSKALIYDSSNIKIYNYWTSLLLKDSNNLNQAKKINSEGLKIDSNNLELKNNSTWILMYENKKEEAFKNAVKILEQDTLNNQNFYKVALISTISMEDATIFSLYNDLAKKNGIVEDSILNAFINKEISLQTLYNNLK